MSRLRTTLPIGATTLSIYPAIIPPASSTPYAGLPYTPQQYQTVTASPTGSGALTPYLPAATTFRRNFAYAPQMITMATGDMPIPANLQQAARHRYDNVSMRSLTQYQIGTDQEITRLDVLFGSLSPRPEWGCMVPDVV